ncbi:acyl-CoA reductase [Chondrinema litorale]|nr:acyl-CoA reductase [Chondrinema litorale]UZR96248.1 acyl-CoA reductase [Chondrinema litorale]
MGLEDRINAFVLLGKEIDELLKKQDENEFQEICFRAYNQNTWFTKESVEFAFRGISNYLKESEIKNWARGYKFSEEAPKVIGTVMAGNIPMVGFHDLMAILISGNKVKAKLSTLDQYLIKFLASKLINIDSRFENYIEFSEMLKNVDALIATGSDNSARYFEYYFRNVPHLIRRNRTSCAVLKGDETKEDLEALATDITTYFGLGCRNVSKLFVPENYSFNELLLVLEENGKLIAQNHKYANNYDYNKSIYLVNRVPHLDNGYMIFREDISLFSPISVIHFEYYREVDFLEERLKRDVNNIQCIVSANAYFKNSIPFGDAQLPSVSDYADGVDTLEFLQKI